MFDPEALEYRSAGDRAQRSIVLCNPRSPTPPPSRKDSASPTPQAGSLRRLDSCEVSGPEARKTITDGGSQPGGSVQTSRLATQIDLCKLSKSLTHSRVTELRLLHTVRLINHLNTPRRATLSTPWGERLDCEHRNGEKAVHMCFTSNILQVIAVQGRQRRSVRDLARARRRGRR
jgi:hypothetical protein